MPQERSIRQYLRPLGRHSMLIGLIVVFAAAVSLLGAVFINELLPYEAEAVLLFKSNGGDRVVLTDGSEFRANILDTNRQARNVQVLISSLDIAQQVKERGAADGDAEVKALVAGTTIDLRREVSTESRGDLIYVRAQAGSATAATWLANAWAEEAIAKTNRVYALSSSQVAEALEQARTTLTADQQALQRFLADNPIATLRQELTQTNHLLAAAGVSQAEGQFTLYSTERQAVQDTLNLSYTYVYTLEQQLSEVQALRTRIEQSSEDPDSLYSNQVALLVLLNKLISGTPGPQVQLQVNPGAGGTTPLTRADQLRDVDATIAAVRKLQSDLQTQITTLEEKLRAPLPALTPGAPDQLPTFIQEQIRRKNRLESELEAKEFELAQLEKTRDLHQDTYDLLRSRLAEQQLNEVISRVVDIGVPADVAGTLQSRSLARTLALVVGQGVLIALVLALGLAYLLNLLRPGFDSNAALRRVIRRRAGDTARAESGG